jgi:hypothetical protein
MRCPHCLENFHEEWERDSLVKDADWRWYIDYCTCPACEKIIIYLSNSSDERVLVYPKGISRSPIPAEVDDPSVISDYKEACLVFTDSPKASAALSRRCLQYILREKASVKHADLSTEIQEVINSRRLPSDLTDSLDYVRVVGNFGAHPIKSKSSGEVVEVEPGEAEWNLNVIEDLIDYYFVRPVLAKKKKTAINTKLREAGKPELPI